MATARKQKTEKVWIAKPTRKRPGRHSKKKSSKLKSSKNYLKAYRGQG